MKYFFIVKQIQILFDVNKKWIIRLNLFLNAKQIWYQDETQRLSHILLQPIPMGV